jgi:hypothetical protein
MVYFVMTNWHNKHGQDQNKIHLRNTRFIDTMGGFAEQTCSRSLLVASTCRTEPRSCKTTRRAQSVVQTDIHWNMALRSLALCQLCLTAVITDCTRLFALCFVFIE